MTPSERLTAIHRRSAKRITIEPASQMPMGAYAANALISCVCVLAIILALYGLFSGAFIADQIIKEASNV